MERPLDRVLGRLVGADAPGSSFGGLAPGGVQHVEVLAHVDLEPELVPHLPGRAADAGQQPVGQDEGQVAHQDGGPLTEAPALAPPPVGLVAGLERHVDGGQAPPRAGAVHDVVVHEGEAVEQLEGGTGLDPDRVGGVAPGAGEAPVAEGRAEALAAAQDEAAESVEWRLEVGVEARPPGHLGVKDRLEPGIDRLGHLGQPGRRGGAEGHHAEPRPAWTAAS